MRLLWGFNRLLFFLPACGVHLQERKSPFLPFLCFACLLCLGLPVLVSFHLITDKKKRPLLGRFSLGSCGGVWFLPVSGLVVSEHCKRCGAFAKYPYFLCCGVGFNPSGGWACDIIQIASIGGLCHCLAIIDSYFFSHGVGLLEFKRFSIIFGL